MYQVTVNIADESVMALLAYVQTLQEPHVQKVIKIKSIHRKLPPNFKALAFNTSIPEELLKAVTKPLKQHVTAAELVAEQHYKGTNWAKLNEMAKELAIQEPIELLFEQLKK